MDKSHLQKWAVCSITNTLYANSGNNGEGIDLVFTGTAYTGSGVVTLTLESAAEFEGINLVGNPFADTAYIADGRPFYRLDQNGEDVKLVFATGDANADDHFAFISDGDIIVNGEGTLQVIDMLGRQLYSHEVHSDFRLLSSDLLSSGVYVLRLINGENVKTQKIIVK